MKEPKTTKFIIEEEYDEKNGWKPIKYVSVRGLVVQLDNLDVDIEGKETHPYFKAGYRSAIVKVKTLLEKEEEKE